MLTWNCFFTAAVNADIIQYLKDLEREANSRLFWVSLRSKCGTPEMEFKFKEFKEELRLEVFHFKD